MPLRQSVIMCALMSLIMGTLMTGYATLATDGLSETFLRSWAHRAAMGWPVAFVLSMLVSRPVAKLAAHLAGVRQTLR